MNCYLGGGGEWGEKLNSSIKSTVVMVKQASSSGQKATTIFRGKHLQLGSKVPPAALFKVAFTVHTQPPMNGQFFRSPLWPYVVVFVMPSLNPQVSGKLVGNKETKKENQPQLGWSVRGAYISGEVHIRLEGDIFLHLTVVVPASYSSKLPAAVQNLWQPERRHFWSTIPTSHFWPITKLFSNTRWDVTALLDP